MQTIKDAFQGFGVLREEYTSQTHKGVVMLNCIVKGRTHRIALDYFDHHDFINDSALDQCSLYIKWQYNSAGYADPRIVRGGYPVTDPSYYRFYAALRRYENPSPKFDVVGRFGFEFQEETRRRAVDMLSNATDINFAGRGGKIRYSRFLREIAAARLSLHMPGNGPFTHRVAEFLGLGTCMISQRFAAELHVPLVPGTHYIEIAEDLHDLLERTRFYLAHEDDRNRIAAAGRDYFDRYLHADQIVSYYIRTLLDQLSRE